MLVEYEVIRPYNIGFFCFATDEFLRIFFVYLDPNPWEVPITFVLEVHLVNFGKTSL